MNDERAADSNKVVVDLLDGRTVSVSAGELTWEPRDRYDVARMICHRLGVPWTDPRTGIEYPPPTEH